MKKFFMILALLFVIQPAIAQTVHVQTTKDFSTENPPKSMSVLLLDDLVLNETLTIPNGSILYGDVVDVIDPKRLKRDATFSFELKNYITTSGENHNLEQPYTGKYTTKLNKAQIAKSAALSVGNHFVEGLSIGYSAIEGAVKNEKGNRLKSSASAAYEKTPFSYVRKGGEIVIEKDKVFLLNFKTQKSSEIEE